MKKKLFINDDFVESQYLWMIPIIDGFCEKNNISNIIMYKEFPLKILDLKIIKDFKRKYSIEILNKKFFFDNFFVSFILIIKNFTFFSKIFIKSPLKNKSDWFNLQIDHSIWDYSNLMLNENNLKKNIFVKLYSLFVCLKKINLARDLVRRNVLYAFIGHSVYFSRALMAQLRKNGVEIYNQTSFNIYKQPYKKDRFWSEIKKKDLKKLNKLNLLNLSQKYWKLRSKGKGHYQDSQLAIKKTKKFNIKEKNFVFLHIFRDSPFNIIDKQRIFDDYFEWFIETIKIINKSNEKWYLKFHPSHKLWGEDQEKIINILLKKHNLKLGKNIKIENDKLSNQDIFKKAKRILTFSGTPHLEIAGYGIKPIVISKNTLEAFDSSKVLKPRSIDHYKQLLLINSESKIFKLKIKEIYLARKLLFIRENILTLKQDLDSFITYRRDTKKNILKELNIIKKNSLKNYKNLFFLGYNLRKLKRTISFKYIKYYI